MAALGLVLMVVGVVLVGVFFAKPWRTCEDDTAPAGCPGGIEPYGVLAGMALGAAGTVMTITGGIRLGNGPWNGHPPTRPQKHNADSERKNERT